MLFITQVCQDNVAIVYIKFIDLSFFNRTHFGKKNVTVTVTPNGYADAVTDGYFVLPLEKVVPFENFLGSLDQPTADRVYYIQKQNSNLTEEYPELVADSAAELTWATEAFGSKPDAINFWMGDERAITSSNDLECPLENIFYALM